MTKKLVPWASIEAEFRAGNLSTREIARQFGITETAIRKRARKLGLTRDLQEQVRRKVRNGLVRTTAGVKTTASDEQAVEGAAKKALDVVLSHRKDIANLRDREQELLNELGDKPKKSITKKIGETTICEIVDLSLTERASILRDIATVQAKRIELEREAYNLDAESGDEESEETIQITYYRVAPFPDGI